MRRLTLIALILLLAGPARGEERRPPGSIFAAVNLGGGWSHLKAEDQIGVIAESKAQPGVFWGFRIGQAVSEIFVLGVDYVAYTGTNEEPDIADKVETDFWVIGPSLSWYPTHTGLFAKFLAGWGGVDFQLTDGDVVGRANSRELGLVGSIGYESPVSGRLSIGAQLDYVWMSVTEADVANGVGGTNKADLTFDTWGLSALVMMNY